MTDMSLLIAIDWPYFLGIMAGLIVIAWYGGSRLTGVEKDVSWLKKTVDKIDNKVSELSIKFGNEEKKLFNSSSPIQLTPKGDVILRESGLRAYLDNIKSNLLRACEDKRDSNPYEVQQCIFDLFDSMQFDPEFNNELKKYAYESGIEMDILRRVGAIYFRDLCLVHFGMNVSDIDNHKPEREKQQSGQHPPTA